ncbi:hypothetical protein [Chitinophaga sp.]|uniref:hypothetical protein n=1 Tax=Chitinophaga sp. TaxID=1869181 RepID=UPI0026069052|nr:hypothetical protein [uncultured Chitinophaga sp.]
MRCNILKVPVVQFLKCGERKLKTGPGRFPRQNVAYVIATACSHFNNKTSCKPACYEKSSGYRRPAHPVGTGIGEYLHGRGAWGDIHPGKITGYCGAGDSALSIY